MSQLPIACTLGPQDGAQRLADWHRLAARAGDGHTRTPGTLTLRFCDLPSVEDELKQLVSAERTCCAFLRWTLDRDGDRWLVEVTGDEDDLAVLRVTG